MPVDRTASRPRVSIAMATYNGERHVGEQLESLAAQTVLPWELVVTDDGSSDRTLEIIEKFARTAPFPVRMFKNPERLGYGDNFLKAAAICSGSQIAFCDQDDVWNVKKLERSIALFADSGVIMTSHNALVIDQNGKLKTGRTFEYRRRRRIFVEKRYWAGYSGFTLMFRRIGLMEHILANETRVSRNFRIDHDEIVSFVSMVTGKIGLSREHLVSYRRHETNTTTTTEPIAGRSKGDAVFSSYRALRRRCLMAKKIFPSDWNLPQGKAGRPWLVTALHLRRRLLVYGPQPARNKLLVIAANFWIGVYGSEPRVGLGKRALIADLLSVAGFFR